MTKEEEDFVYSRIGMALVSTQRVEFITGQLLELLQSFDKDVYGITSAEFLEQTEKSKKSIKTLGQIFKLLKLNPKLVVESELDSYLKKRNLFVHSFWIKYMRTKDQANAKLIIDFCYDFGRHSDRIESFFKGFVYFLSLRHVKSKDDLDSGLRKWDNDFEYFIKSLTDNELTETKK
jgi:hypothetical protein